LVEVTLRAVHEVLIEVDDNILLIVVTPQGDFRTTAQASPNSLLNIILVVLINNIKLHII
jgi:hypothetical protein